MNEYLKQSRLTLALSVPFIINQLLQISIVTIDSLMAGADSDVTLAAIAQGGSLLILVELILIGLSMPLTPMFARFFARKDTRAIRMLFQQGIWLSLFLSLLGIVAMLFLPDIMVLIGVDAAIIPHAKAYLSVMTLAIPFFSIYLPVRYINEGIGNPKVIMYITMVSIPLNVVGNYVFLNGLWGVPKMGAAGIALSSVISLVVVMLIGWLYVAKNQTLQSWGLLKNFARPDAKILANILRIGFPNAIAFTMETGMFAAVALLSGRMGVSMAAANQIAYSYISILFMVPLGLSFAITTRIGMAAGENNLHKAKVIGVSGIFMGFATMVFSVLVILFFGEAIAMFYSNDETVVRMALGLLALAAVFQIPDGIQVCSAGALRGLEETKAPMRYAILGYWILAMPLAILLAFYFGMAAKGLWVGLICGLTVTAFLGTRKFIQLTRVPAPL